MWWPTRRCGPDRGTASVGSADSPTAPASGRSIPVVAAARPFAARLPAPPLRAFIDRYVGYCTESGPSGFHRGLPSRHLTFIASIGDPIDVLEQTDPTQAPERYGFVLSGLQSTPALVAAGGRQEGVAIELSPLGCRALFGLPARALWNTSVEADQVSGPAAIELRDRLHATADWADRFAVCDEVLSRLAHGRKHLVAAPLGEVWRLVVASSGELSVADLATRVGWGRRHLADRFREEFGLPPGLAARVVRFDRARRMLQSPERPTIADVAAACGYYDQPHLNRDFVAFAGCPPGRWMADELPSVQDSGAVAVASSAT